MLLHLRIKKELNVANDTSFEPHPCARCGNIAKTFIKVDSGMNLRLQESGHKETLPETVCAKCYTELGAFISQGARLRAERVAKDQNRLTLWRSRVNLVRQARLRFEAKALSESAVLYEKYLRVLEIVYDQKSGNLAPEQFNNLARSKELTVIASVYWDLFRIYDTSPRYGDRQVKAGAKLAQFLKFTPGKADIVNQISSFEKVARNPEAVKGLLLAVTSKNAYCFIVTASFQPEESEILDVYTRFRDHILLQRPEGRLFTRFYYRTAPLFANTIAKSSVLKKVSRFVLRLLASCLRRML